MESMQMDDEINEDENLYLFEAYHVQKLLL
jgi:hypothetical protein